MDNADIDKDDLRERKFRYALKALSHYAARLDVGGIARKSLIELGADPRKLPHCDLCGQSMAPLRKARDGFLCQNARSCYQDFDISHDIDGVQVGLRKYQSRYFLSFRSCLFSDRGVDGGWHVFSKTPHDDFCWEESVDNLKRLIKSGFPQSATGDDATALLRLVESQREFLETWRKLN